MQRRTVVMDMLDSNNPELEADLAKFQRFSLRALPPGVDLEPEVWDARARSVVGRIDNLLKKYPGHPDLLELRGLYCQDSLRALEDFRKAIANAVERGYPTFVLRMHIAFVLINAFMDAERAKAELDAASAELQEFGDDEQKAEYARLLADVEECREGYYCDCGNLLKALKEPKCPSCGLRL